MESRRSSAGDESPCGQPGSASAVARRVSFSVDGAAQPAEKASPGRDADSTSQPTATWSTLEVVPGSRRSSSSSGYVGAAPSTPQRGGTWHTTLSPTRGAVGGNMESSCTDASAATTALPFALFQSAGVACPMIMVSTLQNAIFLAESLGTKSLVSVSCGAFGHSQGVASAAVVSMLQHAAHEAPSLLLQGLMEQQHTGLSFLSKEKAVTEEHVSQTLTPGMLALGGRPTPRMQLASRLGRTSIINSESAMVRAGVVGPEHIEQLRSPAWSEAGITGNMLPMPFSPHSTCLEPAFHRLEGRLRTMGLPGKSSVSAFPVQQTSSTVAPCTRRPEDAWRTLRAMQMTMHMDFPGTAEGCVSHTGASTLVDCGPSMKSVCFKLLMPNLKNVNFTSTVTPASGGVFEDGGAVSAHRALVSRVREAIAKVPGILDVTVEDRAPLTLTGLTSQTMVSFYSKLLDTIPECRGVVPLVDVLRAKTITEVAFTISKYTGTSARQDLGGALGLGSVLPPITRVFALEGVSHPMSHSQELMLRFQHMNPHCTAFNVSSSIWIAGGVDPHWLQSCVARVLSRHEVFLTTANLAERSLKMRSVTPMVSITKVVDEAGALARMGEVGKIPFALASEASIRVEVAVLPSGLVLLIVWAHHMNFDSVSEACFYRELYLLLSRRDEELPKLAVQYTDFAHWSRQCLASRTIDPSPVLDDLMPHADRVLDLPTDFPRPSKWTYRGDSITTVLPCEPTFPHEGITPFIAYLTAFFMQLWKNTGQEVVVVGVQYHGRDQEDVKDLCGNFVNMVCVEGEVHRGVTVSEALKNTQHMWHRALQHASVPFLHLVDMLSKDGGVKFGSDRHPVFQAMINYRVEATESVADNRFWRQPVHQLQGLVDLDIVIDKGPEGIIITHNYATDLFLPRTAERFAAQYMACLKAIMMREWAQVECWRIPYSPTLVDDVTEANTLTPEIVTQKMLPQVVARLHRPMKQCDRDGLPVRSPARAMTLGVVA